MRTFKISTMRNANGTISPSQFTIDTPEGRYYQSENDVVAFIPNGKGVIELDIRLWGYIYHTKYHLRQFLNEDTREIRRKVWKGIYILTNFKTGNNAITSFEITIMRNIWGNPAQNHFIISVPEGTYFQSKDIMVVFIPNKGKIELNRELWDSPHVIAIYRNQFLGENVRKTRRKIENGIYKLSVLN